MIEYAKIADNEHCVYVIWAVLNDRMFVKVGMSSYLCQRIVQVCQGVPFDMQSAIILKGVNRYHVAEIEASMHRRLAKHRTRGEWFAFDSAVDGLSAIQSLTWEMSMKHNMDRAAIDVDAMKQFYLAEVSATRPQQKYKTVKQKRAEATAERITSAAIARAQRSGFEIY